MVGKTNNQLRGVNLGGWLVLERWITPSLFEGTTAQDEYTFMQESGASGKIEEHRRTFITENDFIWLSEHGINAVRIPIGHWIFDGDGPFTACISYLDWAMEMAEKYKIKVLIDLHAARGSQNGKDHSGRIGRADWYKNKEYQIDTIKTLRRIAERHKDSSALWGIELLNEPALGPRAFFLLRQFYKEAFAELRTIMPPGTYTVFSDGFVPRLFSGAIEKNGEYPVAMDIHWYQFGRTDLSKCFKKLARRPNEINQLERHQPIIIGEWSGMLSHQTLAGLSKAEQELLEKRHIKEQLAAYSGALGWFYWTYKTETASIWDFRVQVERGNLLLA